MAVNAELLLGGLLTSIITDNLRDSGEAGADHRDQAGDNSEDRRM
jgi:hypothetical protein